MNIDTAEPRMIFGDATVEVVEQLEDAERYEKNGYGRITERGAHGLSGLAWFEFPVYSAHIAPDFALDYSVKGLGAHGYASRGNWRNFRRVNAAA